MIGRLERIFVAGTNPEVVRGVFRRLQGADEASLAQTPFYRQQRALLEGTGVSLAFDAVTLGATLEGLGGSFADATTEPFLQRAVAVLRTLGSYAGRLQVIDNEVRLESRLGFDPQGGDPELAALLLNGAPVQLLTLVPEMSSAVSVGQLQPRQLFAYLESWDRLTEGPGSLRHLARQELDLDTALLDWLDNEVTSIVLVQRPPIR